MTQPIYKNFTLQACDTQISISGTNRECDPDFFASNVTGASFALTTTETTDGMAHQVCIRNDAVTDHSAKTITINGFYGIYPVSETINLPAGSATVKTSKFFTKITSPLVPSATIGTDTMDIGIVEICRTPLIKSEPKGNNEGINTSFDNETAINYTIKFTRTKVEPDSYQHYINCYTDIYDALRWFDHDDADVVDATTDTSTNTQEPPTAYTWQINSYTQSSTPTIYIEITQSSID
jgi:hypothetical protein